MLVDELELPGAPHRVAVSCLRCHSSSGVILSVTGKPISPGRNKTPSPDEMCCVSLSGCGALGVLTTCARSANYVLTSLKNLKETRCVARLLALRTYEKHGRPCSATPCSSSPELSYSSEAVGAGADRQRTADVSDVPTVSVADSALFIITHTRRAARGRIASAGS